MGRDAEDRRPMMLRLPRLGMEMTEGTLTTWLVADGAAVAGGDPIYEVETDKITNEVAAPAAGRLRQLVEAGTTLEVGAPVGELT